MTGPCFVDANVLVYALDRTDLAKQQVAEALLNRLWREQTARTSVQALNEFYTVVTRKTSHPVRREEAWLVLEDLLGWNPQSVDVTLLHRACAIEVRYKLNWWDCLIVAAAQLQSCSILYSEDLQHGAVYDGVRVCNPFKAQVLEDASPYRAVVVSGHRPRGRPRKVA
jgi:predicted nucleic acid-binding protein